MNSVQAGIEKTSFDAVQVLIHTDEGLVLFVGATIPQALEPRRTRRHVRSLVWEIEELDEWTAARIRSTRKCVGEEISDE